MKTAKTIALDFAKKYFDLSDLHDRVEIICGKTVAIPQGWVFYFNSARFLASGEFGYMLMGNRPVFVNIETGKVCFIRGDVEIEEAVAEVSCGK